MYKSILSIVELVLKVCHKATFPSLSAWNNGKALDSESSEPGSILAVAKILFLLFFFIFRFFGFVHSTGLLEQNQNYICDQEDQMHQ